MKAPGEAQEFLYRREALKSPDEVLSEARKNHSVFKANVVSGGLRPSIRHVGLSRFQFGDGEYAASVEAMQRMVVDKAARPEPLPEMQRPVQITRTLSRSLSSGRNPFLSPSRPKPRQAFGIAASTATAITDCPSGEEGSEAREGSFLPHRTTTSATAISEASITNGATAPCQTQNDGAFPDAAAITTTAVAGNSTAASKKRSPALPPAESLPSSRATGQSPPTLPSGGGVLSSHGTAFCKNGSGGGGSVCGGGHGSGNEDGNSECEGDGRERSTAASPAATLFSGILIGASTHQTQPHQSGHNSDVEAYLRSSSGGLGSADVATGPPSSSNIPMLRNSAHSTAASPVGAGGSVGGSFGSSESSTGRVDQLLRNLHRLRGLSLGTASGPSTPRGGGSARRSLNGSGRFESARELFIRSATMHLPATEDGRVGQAAVAAAVLAGSTTWVSSGGEAPGKAAYPHQQQHHLSPQQAPRPQLNSASQLQPQVQPTASSPSLGPPGAPWSPGAQSPLLTLPGAVSGGSTAAAAAAAAAPAATAVNAPIVPMLPSAVSPPAAAAAQQGSAAATAAGLTPRAYQLVRSPTGDDDRIAPHLRPNSLDIGSTLIGLSLAASATSPVAAGGGGGFGGDGEAAPAATGASPGGGMSPGGGGRVGPRRFLTDIQAAPTSRVASASNAPLDGWSSRGGGADRSRLELRRNTTVGSFFSNLLSAAGSPARPTGRSALA